MFLAFLASQLSSVSPSFTTAPLGVGHCFTCVSSFGIMLPSFC
jgi:hypothetical protein